MGQFAGPPAVADRPRRVICPYVRGMLNPDTQRALWDSGLPVDFVRLPAGDETAYGRMLRNLWGGRETFVICEQDIVPTVAQLSEIAGCGHLWCSYNYDDGLYPDGPMFGLVRFSGGLMDLWPEAANVALVIGKRRDYEAEWWRVDSLVARDLNIRQVPWVLHTPAVHHAHVGPPSGPA